MQEGNEGFVHHLLIYECHGKFNESLYGPGFDCHSTANMPLSQCYSSSVVAAWAVGGEVRVDTENHLNKMGTFFFFPFFFLFFFPSSLLSSPISFFVFLFHLLLCNRYPGILLPAKSRLSDWNCGFSEQLLARDAL